jgi:FAD synthetase
MRTVLVFGTFDVIHPGHLSFLEQARRRGDRLIASIARDDFVVRFKGRKPLHGQEQRLARIRETGLVDEAHLSDPVPGTYSLIGRCEVDVVCLGHDQDVLKRDLEGWLAKNRLSVEIATMEPYKPELYKSSKMAEKGPGSGTPPS